MTLWAQLCALIAFGHKCTFPCYRFCWFKFVMGNCVNLHFSISICKFTNLKNANSEFVYHNREFTVTRLG
jgi:hypothetical protein